ncbi:immunoglobulin lambda-1 light chain-like [Dicentrarchus labrax]|uniref:immunoglobulin lambda-1 light chain-like n=1 Tax=Dicentrarchus labrax TaxID=13489 RepID=UPI0021F59E1C|nr:immunoglobulin lambda-1 light chain-like [Dicentrarchus labrax]
MLFLPAAALCCLCSALVAMAAELSQDHLTLTRRVGQTVSFSCGGTQQCDLDYVFWYQKKDTETFTRILYIDSDGDIDKSYNHPQEDDFSAVNKGNVYELQIQTVKLSHSATYYCACWKYAPHIVLAVLDIQQQTGFCISLSHCADSGDYYDIFGSGTKLYVTDEQIVKPVVSVYPAASRAHLEGKSSLLCVASDMFPPLVRFSWKRQKDNGTEEDVTSAEGEQLELRESGRTTSILLIPQRENSTYKYRCSVHHEGFTVEAQTEQEVPAPAASCPPEREPADLPALQQADLSFQSQCQVKLLCLMYTVLIVKSLVYCCGLSLLMILRNKGPSTNCTHAD